jgi:hypothetical protein
MGLILNGDSAIISAGESDHKTVIVEIENINNLFVDSNNVDTFKFLTYGSDSNQICYRT